MHCPGGKRPHGVAPASPRDVANCEHCIKNCSINFDFKPLCDAHTHQSMNAARMNVVSKCMGGRGGGEGGLVAAGHARRVFPFNDKAYAVYVYLKKAHLYLGTHEKKNTARNTGRTKRKL